MRPHELELLLTTARLLRARLKHPELVADPVWDIGALEKALESFNKDAPITGDVQTVLREIPDSEGDKWVDIPRSQVRAIENKAIEMCATALEQDALYNRRVAADPEDFLETRAKAEHTADTKNACANILRTLKGI